MSETDIVDWSKFGASEAVAARARVSSYDAYSNEKFNTGSSVAFASGVAVWIATPSREQVKLWALNGAAVLSRRDLVVTLGIQ